MNCDEAREMLAGYADGELSPVENDALAAHLQECGRCRQIVHDQQRVQHVFDQYPVPTVSEQQWADIGKRLRAELEGKAEPIDLSTRPRADTLEPEPRTEPPAEPETESEPAAEVPPEPKEPTPPPRPAREVPAPGPGHQRAAPRQPAPTLIVHEGRPRRGPSLARWLAHAVGAAAAAAVILLSLVAMWRDRAPPLEPGTLARQGDVDIIEMECDPTCSVILQTGDVGGVMAIWVEPEESNG